MPSAWQLGDSLNVSFICSATLDIAATTVTSKGEITIPADVRRALRVASGDRVEFVEIEPGRFEIIAATGSILELQGMFSEAKRSVSIDEMNEAMASQGSSAALSG